MNEYTATEQAFKNGYNQGRAEAIKEFAERVKAKAMQKFDWNEYVEVEDIDQIAKEMGVE